MGKPVVTANHVTFARLLSMPMMVWLFYQGETGQWWAFGLGAVIATTDFVDGYLARKYGPTVLGGLMDPIADKVFIVCILLPLVDLGWVPGWMVALMFVRDLLITALRTAYELRGIRLKTSYIAKVKTWVQMQGVATMIFFILVDDRAIAWWVIGSATVAPAVVVVAGLVIWRKFLRGAAIMVGAMLVLDALYLPGDRLVTLDLMTAGMLNITWASGLDYLYIGIRQMRGKAGFGKADMVRIAGALALPVLCLGVMVDTTAPVWIAVTILCIELAVGGLDNLYAHHDASSGTFAWGLRTLTTSALLGAAWLAQHHGYPDYVEPLGYAAMGAMILGGAREFWRGRRYYV